MSKDEILKKVTSRKFVLALAAFLGCLGMGLGNVVTPEVCAVCMALSAAIYAACEAYVDGKSAGATQTIITAQSTDKATVAKLLTPDGDKGQA